LSLNTLIINSKLGHRLSRLNDRLLDNLEEILDVVKEDFFLLFLFARLVSVIDFSHIVSLLTEHLPGLHYSVVKVYITTILL
jgi:hypothetical protein